MNTKRVIQYFATIAATGDLAKKKDSKMKVRKGGRKREWARVQEPEEQRVADHGSRSCDFFTDKSLNNKRVNLGPSKQACSFRVTSQTAAQERYEQHISPDPLYCKGVRGM